MVASHNINKKMISKFKHFNKFTSRHHTRLFLFSKQQQRFQSNNSDSIEKQLAQLGIESHSGSKVEKKDDESKKPILNQRGLFYSDLLFLYFYICQLFIFIYVYFCFSTEINTKNEMVV